MLKKNTDGKSRVQRRHHEFLKDSNLSKSLCKEVGQKKVY